MTEVIFEDQSASRIIQCRDHGAVLIQVASSRYEHLPRECPICAIDQRTALLQGMEAMGEEAEKVLAKVKRGAGLHV